MVLKKNKLLIFISTLTFLFFAFLSKMLGYNADDYWWGSTNKLSEYVYSLKFINYDGRYVGNSLAILGMHYPYLAAIIFGLTMSMIVLVMYWLSKNITSTLIGLFFILILPTHIFAQTIGWKAGFFNYSLSIIPILVLLLVGDKLIFLGGKAKP